MGRGGYKVFILCKSGPKDGFSSHFKSNPDFKILSESIKLFCILFIPKVFTVVCKFSADEFRLNG